MLDTSHRLFPGTFPALTRERPSTLQVNLGYLCNQQCQHCHVNAGPGRPEQMSGETVRAVLATLERGGFETLDLTGGAPELNMHFRELVSGAAALGIQVIDRCNLTVLLEPGQDDLGAFLAANAVAIVASLPCYLEENVDAQRGRGVFERSIEALRILNELGYGQSGGLSLGLVYNPQGPVLPPPQAALEADYRERLGGMGISFSHLMTIANMPIQRFGSALVSRGEFDDYLGLLKNAHCDANLAAVMCRHTISVDWRGYLYDCDFNQMLDLPMQRDGRPVHLSDLLDGPVDGLAIQVGDHCYGCTAGQGSSCGGALS